MTARFSALLTLLLGLLLALPAAAQDILGETLRGSDTLNVELKGPTTFSIKRANFNPAVLSIDALGVGTYSTRFDIDGNPPGEPIALDVSIDTSGRRPVLRLDDPAQLESALAVIIRAHNPSGYRTVTVSVDASSIKTKLKTRSNLTLNTQISIDAKFTATTQLRDYEMLEGRLKLRPRVSATLPGSCVACGASYSGNASVATQLTSCGAIVEGTSDASLVIDPDDDDNGSASFAMLDSIGTNLFGLTGHAGKRLACTIQQAGQDQLLSVIRTEIVNKCGPLLQQLTDDINRRLRRTDLEVVGLRPGLNFLICEGRVSKNDAEQVRLDFFMSYRTQTILAPHANPQVGPSQGPRGTSVIEGKFRRDAP